MRADPKIRAPPNPNLRLSLLAVIITIIVIIIATTNASARDRARGRDRILATMSVMCTWYRRRRLRVLFRRILPIPVRHAQDLTCRRRLPIQLTSIIPNP